MSIDTILARIVSTFAETPGVVAIALGGSRARGWHGADSDIDIGLYYRGTHRLLDPAWISLAAQALDDQHRPDLASAHGGWGAWVDGGAWLTVDTVPVDLIYRDLDRIDAVIGGMMKGQVETAYHYGHPHAFVSVAYAGELAIAQPLHDPNAELERRKAGLTPYPEPLVATLAGRFLDEAVFTLPLMRKGEARGDVAYARGCGFRIVSCLCQVVFALNRQWLINEKGAAARAGGYPLAPARFEERVGRGTANDLASLIDEVAALAAL